jgi:hypothetical protein
VASNDGASTVAMRFQIAPKSSFSSEDGQIKFLPFSGPASYFSLPCRIKDKAGNGCSPGKHQVDSRLVPSGLDCAHREDFAV